MKSKKLVISLGIIILVFYFGHTLGKFYESAPEKDMFDKISWIFENLTHYKYLDFKFTQNSLYTGLFTTILLTLLYLRFSSNKKNYRHGVEHGSARYSTLEEIKSFEDEKEENNMIFTKNARMGLYNKRLPYEKQLNKNVIVLGGSGSGKTFTYVKPNAMQLNGSKIFTDTKGLLVRELGNLYEKNGYKIRVIDLINFTNSNQFNVFKYIKKETDIDKVAEAITVATKKSDNKGEDFWIQAELMLMKSLIGYLYFDSKHSGYEPNLPQVTDLIRVLERDKEDETSILEQLFEDLNKVYPNNYAYRQFQNFNRNFKGETRNSVKAIISSRFSVFEHEEIRQLLRTDNLEIDSWNTEKTAVFINIPEVNDAYQFISSLLFTTIFENTIKVADEILTGIRKDTELIHLEMYADEFAQIGKINNLSKYLSVVRSREISLKIILQGLPQLDMIYGKEEAKSIINNCETILYLGTNDKETMEYLSFRAGNETIDDKNYSETRRNQGSSTLQHSKLKREVLTAHEVATIDINEALLFIGKQNVFKDRKASVSDHKNSKYLANEPTDINWYWYRRYMNDMEKFIKNTRPSNHIELTEDEIAMYPTIK